MKYITLALMSQIVYFYHANIDDKDHPKYVYVNIQQNVQVKIAALRLFQRKINKRHSCWIKITLPLERDFSSGDLKHRGSSSVGTYCGS